MGQGWLNSGGFGCFRFHLSKSLKTLALASSRLLAGLRSGIWKNKHLQHSRLPPASVPIKRDSGEAKSVGGFSFVSFPVGGRAGKQGERKEEGR